MNKDELIIYAIRTSNAIKEERKQELIDYVSDLEEENQELKQKYENAVADYETTMSELQELKKKLEEINKMIEKCGFVNIEQVMLNYCGLLTQQKEFIKYMKNKINKIEGEIETYDIWHEAGIDINFLILKKQLFMEDLKKYKEIIGEEKCQK